MSRIAQFISPLPLRSPLIKSPPDGVPSTDELEALQEELLALKQHTFDRVRKASNDMRLINEKIRRIEEREKAKQRTVDRIKKERAHTPLLLDTSPPPSAARSRVGSHAGPSIAQRPSMDSTRSSFENSKKKKRKREAIDSDDEPPEPQRIRKASPAPSAHSLSGSHTLTSKAPKIPIPTAAVPKAPNASDWSIPNTLTPPIPTRPPIPPPPVAGPSNPIQVDDDFTKWKQPSQVQVGTFYTSIEPWLRPVKEEDVGYLSYAGDELEPFILPALGPHYLKQWEAQDIHDYGHPLPGMSYDPVPVRARAPPSWEPSTLSDVDTLEERRGQGPLTERLISALLPAPETTQWKGVKAAEEAMEGRPSGGAGAAAARDSMTMQGLENRVKASLVAIRLIEDQTDPESFELVDDPISTAIRQLQRELRVVLATNKVRRQRLAGIAQDRVSYNEYLELRDGLDRHITAMYTKLQKRDTPKPPAKEGNGHHHKKKKKHSAEHGANGVQQPEGPPPPAPSALGLVTDADHCVRAPEALEKLVDLRQQLVDHIGRVFTKKQEEAPGRIWGFPPTSVFAGVDDEVREMLENGTFEIKVERSAKSDTTGDSSESQVAAGSKAAALPSFLMEGVESTELL